MLKKQEKRQRRHKRIRKKVSGTLERPRFCVFRSNKHIYAQLIDDVKGQVILSSSDLKLKKSKERKVDIAYEVGKLIAQKSNEKKIKKVIFDRGGYRYHGRVKALAKGARENGLEF